MLVFKPLRQVQSINGKPFSTHTHRISKKKTKSELLNMGWLLKRWQKWSMTETEYIALIHITLAVLNANWPKKLSKRSFCLARLPFHRERLSRSYCPRRERRFRGSQSASGGLQSAVWCRPCAASADVWPELYAPFQVLRCIWVVQKLVHTHTVPVLY